MRLSKFSEKYKNKSFSLFLKSITVLSIFPILFYFIAGHFSGFGFYIINSELILNSQNISTYNLFLGLLIPTIILFSSIISGLNRKVIAHTFPLITNFTVYGLLIYLLIVIVSFVFCLFLFLNEIAGLIVVYILIGIGFSLSLFYVFPPIIKGVLNFSKISYIPVIGVTLDDKNHSEIFSLVRKLAKNIKTKEPKNIVVSLTTDFYAISKDLKIFNGLNEKIINDETLHISLPLLKILTVKEVSGIIGHELGHFEGKDTDYALKFAPIYRRLNQQFEELEDFFLEEENQKTKSFFIKLAVYPIIFLFNEFSRKAEKISKEQELKADKFGAKASESAKIFITALSKIYIYDLIWNETKENFREMVKEKKIKNLSSNFFEDAKKLLDNKNLIHYLKGMQYYEQLHPSDTHPSLEQRISNLDIKLEDISNDDLINYNPSASSLIKNINIIEQNLTSLAIQFEK